jgi:polyisoprenyl-phosphate glycosyltransferase
VHLSRNFGHQAALTAGLEHALGDVVAMIDADLQDPPELIPKMVEQWEAGSDVVYAVRREREGETAFKLATASWFYKVFNKLTQVDLENNSGDFRLLDRRALDALLSMTERSRFLRGMTVWVGFVQHRLEYKRDARYAGETKYPIRKMLRFSLDAIASFSHLPLQIATYLGFLFASIAFIAIPIVIELNPGRSESAMRRPITSGIARKATPAASSPADVASWRGRCEKEAIASREKRSILRSVYFVSPAWRASRW